MLVPIAPTSGRQPTLGRLLASLVALFVALWAVAAPAAAQVKAPKAGDWYEETATYGFKLKAPKDWEVTPPGPEDANLLVAYLPPRGAGMRIADRIAEVGFWVLIFDDSISDEEYARQRKIKRSKTVEAWIGNNVIGDNWKVAEGYPDAEFKTQEKDFLAKATLWDGTLLGNDVKAFSVEYQLDEKRTLAIVGNGPGDKKEWKAWEKALEKLGKSWSRAELVGVSLGKDAEGLVGPRLERYQEVVAKLPPDGAWQVYVSPNYFVVSNCDDKKFIEEIQDRLEAIRGVFLEDFPTEKMFSAPSDPLEGLPAEAREAYEKMSDEEKAKFLAELENRSSTRGDGVDPAIRATMSVVKIFQGRQAYLDYGAPDGSAGYWWSLTEELCLYEDKSAGRNATFGTLFHEAFHQYMFYYCGGMKGVDLHGWFDEGTADYYGGYEYKGGKVKPKEFKRRRDTIRQMIKDGAFAPIEKFVNWYQKEYYGQNDEGIGQGENYAHGWSFVNFLKQGAKEKPKGWQKEWADLIPTYLEIALTTGDSKKAIEESFGKTDLRALEDAWKAYTE